MVRHLCLTNPPFVFSLKFPTNLSILSSFQDVFSCHLIHLFYSKHILVGCDILDGLKICVSGFSIVWASYTYNVIFHTYNSKYLFFTSNKIFDIARTHSKKNNDNVITDKHHEANYSKLPYRMIAKSNRRCQ